MPAPPPESEPAMERTRGRRSRGHAGRQDRRRHEVVTARPHASRRAASASSPVLAAVATFALEGVRPQEVTVEVDVRRGLPDVHPRRAAGPRDPRVARARPGGAPELRARLPAEAADGEPRARPRAQGGAELRPRDRGRACSRRAGRCPAEELDQLRAGRRALAQRRAAPGARSAERGARALAAPATGGCSSRRRTRPEAALVEGIEVSAIPTLSRLADLLHGRWTPEPAQPGRAGPGRAARRRLPTSPTSAARRTPSERSRSRPRAGTTCSWSARPGAGKTMLARRLPGHPAAAELRGGARDHPGAQRRRDRHRPARDRAAVPRAPPHDLRAGPRGRRRAADARRDHAGAPRRPLPRRAAGVRAERRRRAAAAARGGPGRDHARAAHARLPRERDRGGGLQPLPVRAATRPLRLHDAGARALPAPAQRPARGPDRPRLPGGGGAGGRARGRRRTSAARLHRTVRDRVVAARRRQLARLAGHRRALQRRHGRPAHAPPGAARRPSSPPACSRSATAIALSGRGHDRVLRVARTIADLDGRELVAETRRRRGAVVPARHVAAGRRRDARQLRRLPAPRLPDRPPRAADRRPARAAATGGRTACSACPRTT